jgi:Flp pilus assembly protein TadG
VGIRLGWFKYNRGTSMGEALPKLTRKIARGQELVEFAIILPVLFLIIFGTIDLGRLFFAGVSITNVAREGARYAGLHRDKITLTSGACSAPPSLVTQAACLEAQNSGLNLAAVTVTPSCPDGCDPYDKIVITVTYDFDLLMGALFGADGIELTRTAEMMIQ